MRLAVIVAVTLVARLAHADSDAERLYQEGQAAYDAKRYDEAIAAWDRSYALSKLPALVFNLAQAHRLAGHCTKAVEAYHRFLALDPQSTERPDAEQFLRELEPCADAPDHRPATKPIAAPIERRYEDRGAGKRRTGVIVGGAGLVVFATGLYFGAHASSLATEVEEACASGCEWATVEDKDAAGRRAQTLQYVLYAVGAAGLVGGAALYYLGTKDKHLIVETPRATGATGATGLVIGVGGRF